MRRERPRVLFRVAAGPRIGSGHLVRALRLSSLTGLPATFSIRGAAGQLRVATREQLEIVGGSASSTIESVRPSLLVVDDPSARAAAVWVSAARERGCPVVALADAGHGATTADVIIDGSITPVVRHSGAIVLGGPRYAVVDPAISQTKRRPPTAPFVFISLGGGVRIGHARALARALRAGWPSLPVVVAGGFVRRAAHATPAAGRGVTWLGPQPSLVPWLSTSTIAVVAGGVTLYEACALGVPTIAIPIVPPQRKAVRAMGKAHAVLACRGGESAAEVAHVVRAIEGLLRSPALRRALVRKARATVDGRGALRVSRLLRVLAAGRLAGQGHRTRTGKHAS